MERWIGSIRRECLDRLLIKGRLCLATASATGRREAEVVATGLDLDEPLE